MSYIYRIAEVKDKENIYELYRSVMKDYISQIWGWEEPWQVNDFTTHFNAKNITIVLKNEKLVGYYQVEEKEDYLFLRMLVVNPRDQNNGIGKYVLKALKQKGQKNSKHISLEVFKINTVAKEFYEQHGFNITGETKNSYKMESNA